MEMNGYKIGIGSVLQTVMLGVMAWIVLSIIEHDGEIIRLDERISVIDQRGTSFVQSEVMEKLTELNTDVKYIRTFVVEKHK